MSKKTNDMLKAEQTKVMFESIGAVCHHIGQPATVLSTYLFSLQREEDLSPKVRVQLKECSRAVDKISDILLQIQNIEGYKTVIYRDKHPGESSSKNDNILDIS
jgi:phosphoglycerate-specific signal transduction histidine kinase